MALPANVSFGTVTGSFLRAVADSPTDPDRDPEGLAVTDLAVKFTASINPAVVRDTGSTPPAIIVVQPITASVDANGTLIGPDGQPGVRLIATSNPALQPSGWTWTVNLSSATFPALAFSFALDAGQTIDLATVVQVPSNPGATLAQWLQAVADTQALAGSLPARYVTFGPSAPDPAIAPVWVDTSTTPQAVKGWNGTAWVAIGGGAGGAAIDDTATSTSKAWSSSKTSTSLAAKADLVGGIVPSAQIPALALTSTFPVASQAAMLALTTTQVQPGDVAVITADPGKGSYILVGADPSQLANWTLLNAPTDAVQTVNGQNGTVVLGKADVGLGNVDNTADTAKPISTAQAAVNTQLAGAVGYAGTFRNAWAGNVAYLVGDVVTAEAGLFTCTTAHTANGAGFRYDREKWANVPIPALAAGTTVPVRQQNVTTPGAGIATPLTAGVFQRRPKQFSHRTEKTIAVHQAVSDLTVTRANGTVTLGTAVGGSLILTSPTTATEGQYMGAAFAAAQDLRNGSVKLPISLSAYAGNYFTVDFTSAAGGTDFTNYTRFNLVSGNVDSPRTGQWIWVGANTGDTPDGQGAALADLSAVTGYRYTNYRSTANFTCEIGPRLIFQPTQSTIAKCILWLDDGGFASHQTAIKTAAKYGLPVTIAPTAANLVNGSGGISLDMARYAQDFLGGQVAVHAFGEVDHNRIQSGMTVLEQLLDYQHFGMAAGLTGVEDIAYWSTGLTGPNTPELELTVKKLARSARGGISRQTEALPPIDPWKTRAMMTGGTDTSVGTWQPYAQRAINSKGLAQFVWHDMTGSIPTEFATFCAWLAANSASIQVTTPQGAFDPLCV